MPQRKKNEDALFEPNEFQVFQNRKIHFDSIKEFELKKISIQKSVDTQEKEYSLTLI